MLHERTKVAVGAVTTAHQRIHDELPICSCRWHDTIRSGDDSLPIFPIVFRPVRKERVQEFPRIHRPQQR